MSSARRIKLLLSYAPDWIITLVLAAVVLLLDKVDGFRRDFSLEDTSLHYTFAVHERVPNVALHMIAVVSPLVIMTLVNIVAIRSWWDFHNATLGAILGLSLTGAVTQVVKLTVGQPRPDMLDRCQPPAGLSNPPYKLSNSTICTQTNIAMMRDGFRSFPSGHSSLSFAGLGFLAFYLAGKLHLFDGKGYAGKAWISLVPFLAAALVAISRTMDYRHHWQDVLVGATLGAVLAYFSYRQYYPSLASKNSHHPYAPRVKREDTEMLPIHNLRTFGESQDDGNRISYDDHNYALAGTVPRPDTGHLEHVWREEEDGVNATDEVDVQPYKDSLQLGSKVSISNDAPYTLNLQTQAISTAKPGPEL